MMLRRTSICPATTPGGTGTGTFSPPAPVIEAIETDAGSVLIVVTTTDAQPLTLVLTVDVAQMAMPGVADTAVTTPPASTVALDALDDQVTVVATPASALTAAVIVILSPTLKVAVEGATLTLLTFGVDDVGPCTVTLSPQAAATSAVAVTKRVERRNFM